MKIQFRNKQSKTLIKEYTERELPNTHWPKKSSKVSIGEDIYTISKINMYDSIVIYDLELEFGVDYSSDIPSLKIK